MSAAFQYRKQPLQTFYFLFVGLLLLFVKIPFWTLTSILPSWRPRPSWSILRTLIVKSLDTLSRATMNTSTDLLKDDPEAVARSGKDVGLVWVDPAPELIVGEIKDAAAQNSVAPARVAGYWYGARDADGKVGQMAESDEKVIYNLHGGGWVMGSASPKWDSSYLCTEMMRYNASFTRAFQVEYRLAQSAPFPPKNAFPAAIIDAITGYNYLVNTLGFEPSNILVMGESAGGNLALALVRYLISASLPSIPKPMALFMHSPTADWGGTHKGADTFMVRNRRSDFVDIIVNGGYAVQSLLGNLPASYAQTNAYISPGSLLLPNPKGLFTGLPPTCMLNGNAEMTLDAMKTLKDRIETDTGVQNLRYYEIQDASHIVMTLSWFEPQRTEAYESVSSWLKEITA